MPPKYLYKFEKLNVQTLRNLKNAEIYFNTPASFNDPFDCSALDVSAILTDSKVVEIYKRSLQNNNIPVDSEIDSIKDIPQEKISQIHTAFEKMFSSHQDIVLHQRGCTCFSEENNNILLWSHYADSHRGICLEFDTSYPFFSKVKPVEYSLDFPSIDPVKMLFGNDDERIAEVQKTLLTKYELWRYEKEWRLFHKKTNKEFGCFGALRAVYFGLSVNRTDLETVCLILQGQDTATKFYKASKDKSKYSLSFEEFTYTPYVDIKKK